MESSNKPTELNPVVENLKAVPSLTGGWYINERQQNAGKDLKNKDNRGGASENVEPTGGIPRNGMFCGLTHSLSNLETRIQPLTDLSDQPHRRASRVTSSDRVFWPGVGISPALIKSFPSSIL